MKAPFDTKKYVSVRELVKQMTREEYSERKESINSKNNNLLTPYNENYSPIYTLN